MHQRGVHLCGRSSATKIWSSRRCRRDAARAGSAQQQDLRESVDRQQMWRAVALAADRAEPARIAGGEVVGNQRAGGGDEDDVADHQRKARETPARDLRAGVGRRVARPHDGAVAGVEDVEDSGRTKCVHATVAEGRHRARTGVGIRLPEPDRVAMFPHRLAGGRVVAGDDLVSRPGRSHARARRGRTYPTRPVGSRFSLRQAQASTFRTLDPFEEIMSCLDRPSSVDQGPNHFGLGNLAAARPACQPRGTFLVEFDRDRWHGNTLTLPRRTPRKVAPCGDVRELNPEFRLLP